jgi:hypothetical protein
MPLPLSNHGNNGKVAGPDPEVLEKPVRRKFTAAYKLDMVEAAERCTERGQIGALLRREGLYSSQLSTWSPLFPNSLAVSKMPGLFANTSLPGITRCIIMGALVF